MALNYLRRRPALKRALRPYLLPVLPLLSTSASMAATAYASWVVLHDTLDDADRAAIRAHIATLPARPLISVVMPAYETPDALLRAAIASVRAQLWPHWELCVADDASPSPQVAAILAEAAAADPRIRWTRRPANGHISAASNTAIGLARGEWVALLDHDDILPEHALYELAVEALSWPAAQVIYSDEDKLDAGGHRYDPYFKPDFDPDLLLGQNIVSHFGAYRRDLLERIGGFREGFEGSQDHDLVLRASALAGAASIRHIPAVLYHWRQGAGSASFSDTQRARCIAASQTAIRDHLAERGWQGEVVAAPAAPMHTRVVWPVPEPAPLVSVIVPTRDRAGLLDRCLDGVLHRTDYPSIEVLVADNGSTEPATLALFARLSADPRVRILPMPGPFNYSRLNNQAAAQARGTVLLLLNNDVEVIDGGWLRELVGQAMRPEIGAVGCKLTYANGTLQHGGTVLGAGGVAGHYLTDAPPGDVGPFGALALARTTSAVTAACLALRREVFEAVGGLDEATLAVAFNDVDLCIRIRDHGWRNLWTPFAELHHLESASRGDDLTGERAERFQREAMAMQRRWGDALTIDPYWNPNLSLANARRDLADPPRRVKPWRRVPADRSGLLADGGGPV